MGRLSANDDKGATAARAETKYRKMVIQGRNAFQSEPNHHREAGEVYKRKILIVPGLTDLPSEFQVGRSDKFDGCQAGTELSPEAFCCAAPDPVMQE